MSDDRFTIKEIGEIFPHEDFLSTYPEAKQLSEEIHRRGIELGEYLDSLRIGGKKIVLALTIDVVNFKLKIVFNDEVITP